jgi:hypothetical protein
LLSTTCNIVIPTLILRGILFLGSPPQGAVRYGRKMARYCRI